MNRRTIEDAAHDLGLAALGYLLGVFFYGAQVRAAVLDAPLGTFVGTDLVTTIGHTHRTFMYAGTAVALLTLPPWAYLHARRRRGES